LETNWLVRALHVADRVVFVHVEGLEQPADLVLGQGEPNFGQPQPELVVVHGPAAVRIKELEDLLDLHVGHALQPVAHHPNEPLWLQLLVFVHH
jgi:hypothetical protein